MKFALLHKTVLLCVCGWTWQTSAETVTDEGTANEVQVMLEGSPLPSNEGGCMEKITSWLDRLQWSGSWSVGSDHRKAAFMQLAHVANAVTVAPWVALGVGQALLLYFWWIGDDLNVDIEAGQLSFQMHVASIRHVGCDSPDLPMEIFEHLQCSWRWRHAVMIPSELGIHLARQRAHPRIATQFLQQAAAVEAAMMRLPNIRQGGWPSSYSINSNSFVFAGPINRPIWPSDEVPLAMFLEANANVFRDELDALLQDGSFDGLYWAGEVSLTQFAPKLDDWQMVSLVKNRKQVDRVCQRAPRSCELLAQRPEMMQCNAGDVGAAFARLRAGSGLRPHFWNSPRLGFHLGLRTPAGAHMSVGGQQVAWEEGRATIFDDTYVHGVLHEGVEPRYLLIGWFCHPCDDANSLVPPQRHGINCPS